MQVANMFSNVLVAIVLIPFVMCRTDQLDQECHILQTLEDLQNRLTTAENEVANLEKARTTDKADIASLKGYFINRETQMTNFKTSLTNTETQVTNLKISLASAETRMDQQADEITTVKDSLTAAQTEIAVLQDSLKAAENKIDQQATEIATLNNTLATTESDIENLNTLSAGASMKPNVVFHVRDIAPQPTNGNIIKFATMVENTGGGYNITKGCFTAPTRGSYWFSALVCAVTSKVIVPSIFIRGTLSSRVHVYDEVTGDCSSVQAVSVLEVDDEVCLRSGPEQNANPVWSYVLGNTNNFMGALIN